MHNKFHETLNQWNGLYAESGCTAAEYCAALLLSQVSRFQKKTLVSDLTTDSEVIKKINTEHWVGFTDRIRNTLIQWHLNKYPLRLLRYIPSPAEVLKYQAQGERVVTVFEDFNDWQKNWGPHTAWEFVAHDLIHADHFFENSAQRDSQIQFYQFLEKIWLDPRIEMLHGTPGFEYLISDMNSHPKHLFQTLQALLIEQSKKNQGLQKSDRLPIQVEQDFQKIFNIWAAELSI